MPQRPLLRAVALHIRPVSAPRWGMAARPLASAESIVDLIDLGGIANARGQEMLLPLWVRLYGALGTGRFNLEVVRWRAALLRAQGQRRQDRERAARVDRDVRPSTLTWASATSRHSAWPRRGLGGDASRRWPRPS